MRAFCLKQMLIYLIHTEQHSDLARRSEMESVV